MDFQPPICRYCQQMYSKYNEPIFIVCLCDDSAKYAHGSCFREDLKSHSYGVCGSCLTKTRIVPDGYKPLEQWKIPKLSPIFGFWRRFMTENRYWKIVYCRESKGRKRNRTIRRYSDVPEQLPWQQTRVETDNGDGNYKEEVGFEESTTSEKKGDSNKKFSLQDDGEDSSGGFKIPTVFVPRGYPYVKKNVEYEDDEPQHHPSRFGYDEHFRYYHTLDNLSVNIPPNYWNDRSTDNSMRSNSENNFTDNDVSSENSQRDSAPTENVEDKKGDGKKSKLKKMFKKEVIDTNRKSSKDNLRRSSNNNIAQYSDITTSVERVGDSDAGEIAVSPLENDIIFVPVVSHPQQTAGEEYEDRVSSYKDLPTIHGTNNGVADKKTSKKKTKTTNKKKDKKKKSKKQETNGASGNMYGFSTSMFKPVIQKENATKPIAMTGSVATSCFSTSCGDRSSTQFSVESVRKYSLS